MARIISRRRARCFRLVLDGEWVFGEPNGLHLILKHDSELIVHAPADFTNEVANVFGGRAADINEYPGMFG